MTYRCYKHGWTSGNGWPCPACNGPHNTVSNSSIDIIENDRILAWNKRMVELYGDDIKLKELCEKLEKDRDYWKNSYELLVKTLEHGRGEIPPSDSL